VTPLVSLHITRERVRATADFHVCLDGNFQQRRKRSTRDSPWFYEPEYFISKQEVDEMGCLIETLRPSSKGDERQELPVSSLDDAINVCMESHEAANGNRVKANVDVFADTGLMALLCRHDQPIFYANIDTPGEQQKYPLALLNRLFQLIPESATVCALYDVGCVLERSVQKVRKIIDQCMQ
jgi:hypothetical protein